MNTRVPLLCRLLSHKWGETGPWQDYDRAMPGYQMREVRCTRCDAVVYRQVRGPDHKLIYHEGKE